jgi:hypothetical protein
MGSDNANPHNGIDQISKPRQIESNKGLYIVLADTRSHPDTMVIKTSNTNVAVGTVCAVGRLIVVALITPTIALGDGLFGSG